jgi:ATP-dependent Lon protease
MREDDWYPRDEDHGLGEVLYRRTEELYSIPDSTADAEGIIECPVLPLRDVVIFPRMVSPIFVGRDASLLAIENARIANSTVLALIQEDPDTDDPGPQDFLPIGVEVAVGRLLQMPDGSRSTLVQGRRRVEILEFTQTKPFLSARARIIIEPASMDREIDAMMRTVAGLFERCVQLNRSLPEEAYLYALNIDDPSWLSDMIATALAPSLEDRQVLLETIDAKERLQLISNLLANEIDVLELEDQIHSRVQNEVDRSQREVYLREQIKAIQHELGEGDLWMRDIIDLQKKIDQANLPDEPKERAFKEVERLSQMPPMSPEVGIIRTYLDWILELPWEAKTPDNLDVTHAAQVLDEHHYGLPRAKERILEYIAIRNLKPKRNRQPIMCFVGAPGTGKTSLGKSISEALGREFVRLSLGGVRDEAEIRGHRRTYIGALPGRIIQTMRRAKTQNPLFMLDEVDKLGADVRGDPASALLEVLDPEQNHAFSDHYLEIPYDLANVMFITTANWLGNIPPALLDRMEVIEFPGYIEEEKLHIARRFLIPRQLEECGLNLGEVHFTDQALQRVVREYTYEAGVRNFEREIGRLLRKIARLKAENKRYPSRVSPANVERFMGPPQFHQTEAEREDEVGVVTSLAWTEGGGDIMPIEIALMEGKGNLQITGQIGEVMQESAQAAISFIKSQAAEYQIDTDDFEQTDIHIHVPEGAIPKDGPSAGITLTTALISAFTNRKARKEVGMTGEVTLRGRVLPVGGVREKILAAHRAGLRKVILPRKNMKDLVHIPRRVLDDITLFPVDHMHEVVQEALHPVETSRKTRKPKPPAKSTPSSRKPSSGKQSSFPSQPSA